LIREKGLVFLSKKERGVGLIEAVHTNFPPGGRGNPIESHSDLYLNKEETFPPKDPPNPK